MSARRRRATAPSGRLTVVVTGDSDGVVWEEIHSQGLARDIPGAELVRVRNLGHKPDWIATDLVVAAIEKVAGRDRDLAAAAREVETRIAGHDASLSKAADDRPRPADGVPA